MAVFETLSTNSLQHQTFHRALGSSSSFAWRLEICFALITWRLALISSTLESHRSSIVIGAFSILESESTIVISAVS